MKPRPLALAAVLVALALAGAAAIAGGPKPKIERVAPESALPGGTIEVFGSGFGETTRDIEVTIGGEKSYASDVEPGGTRLSLYVPNAVKKGKVQIVVKVKGEAANLVSLEVLDESARGKKAEEDAATEAGLGQGKHAEFLTLGGVQAASDLGKTVIRAPGTAELPDGCTISLTLTSGATSALDSTTATVASGRFDATFGPYEKPLMAGIYYVRAVFDIHEQSRRIQRDFQARFKEAKERREHELGTANAPVQIGFAGQAEIQEKEIREHILNTAARLREIRIEIDNVFGACARGTEDFRKGGKVDEDEWTAWLAKKPLAGLDDAARTKRAAEMRAKAAEFVSSSGAFLEGKWRDFIDPKREEIALVAKKNQEVREKYQNMRDPGLIDRLGQVADQLVRLSRYRSRELYERGSIPFSEKDPSTAPVSTSGLEQELRQIEIKAQEKPEIIPPPK